MKKRSGSIFLFLFSLPFAAGGLFAGYFAVKPLLEKREMADWVEVPARIQSVDLVESHGSESTTYSVKATYTYQVRGSDFTGTRVSLSSGSDNLGSFHQDVYRRLLDAQNEGREVPCFVDPADASRSILVRDIRWGSFLFLFMFALVFSGVGFGLMAGALFSGKKIKQQEALAAQHPGEPWRLSKDWSPEGINSDAKAAISGTGCFAVFWNLIAWTVVTLFLVNEHRWPRGAEWLMMLFPTIGIFLLWAFIYQAVRLKKYGVSTVVLNPYPGVIGGSVSGIIRVAARIEPEDGFLVKLSCNHSLRVGSGKNSRVQNTVKWSGELRLARQALDERSGQAAIPFYFAVPYDLESSRGDNNDGIIWRLEASASSPGIDYKDTFSIPVYKTSASSASFVPNDAVIRPFLKQG